MTLALSIIAIVLCLVTLAKTVRAQSVLDEAHRKLHEETQRALELQGQALQRLLGDG